MRALAPERNIRGMITGTVAWRYYAAIAEGWLPQLMDELTRRRPPEDLREVYAVQHGRELEGLQLDWRELLDQWIIEERQRWCPHPTIDRFGTTLDGARIVGPIEHPVVETLEVKVVGCHAHMEDRGTVRGVLNTYWPQVALQKECRRADHAYLLVQQGNSEAQLFEFWDPERAYTQTVIAQLLALQRAIDADTAPAVPDPIPVPPERWRTISLDAEDLPNWGPELMGHLEIWRDTKMAHDAHELAKVKIKELVPPDVGEIRWGKVRTKRSRNGALTTREAA